MNLIIALLVGYAVGSIPSAVMVSKLLKLPDPRTEGSKNAGATNVLRISGKIPALLVLFADVIKGLLAVVIGKGFGLIGMAVAMVALAAVIGHVFSVFLRFKGGKGVATAAGGLFALSPWAFVFSLLTWMGVLAYKRFVSLASMAAAAATPVFLLVGGHFRYFIPFVLIAGLIIWKHRDNINRIKSGQEDQFSIQKYTN